MRTSSGIEGIARIEIQKRIYLILVIMFMGFPKLLIKIRPRGIEELQMTLQKTMCGQVDQSQSGAGMSIYSCCSTTFHFLFGLSISSQLYI
uniref:Uncharacterized protein n=1 Tax=Solanum lycopersicum TaxID=4081 RepID=A0A3Q7IV62_SOLLC